MRVQKTVRTRAFLVAITVAVLVWGRSHASLQGSDEARAKPPGSPAFVLTETEAWLQGGVEMIAGPRVGSLHPSPDGRYLLIQRESLDLAAAAARSFTVSPEQAPVPPLGEKSLVLWNSRSRRSSVLWRQPVVGGEPAAATPPAQQLEEIQWLPRSEAALVTTRAAALRGATEGAEPQATRALLLLDAARAALRPLLALHETETLLVAPTQPVAVLHRYGETTRDGAGQEERVVRPAFLRFLRANGSVGRPIPLPTPDTFPVSWSRDGQVVHLRAWERVETPRRRVVSRWFALRVATGAITPLAEEPGDVAEQASAEKAAMALVERLPVRVRQTTIRIKEDTTTQQLRPAWLESVAPSEEPRTLLAADSERALLLPDGSAALYVSRGALFAVPLVRLDKTAFLDARRRALRAMATSNAKQIGMALMMYAQDYDEVFPPGGGDTMNQVLPYVRNQDVFHDPGTGAPGFVYTFGGGSLSGIQEPASTVIGYVTGPGGRAEIYADGHVKWRDD
jgi:hypothetical protein